MSEPIKGYKVFNPDWTCRNFQYEVGKTFEEDVTPKCCDRGFHFCTKASDCFSYYGFNPENKVAEVLALGTVDTESDDTKCCTNKIQIVREISWQELLNCEYRKRLYGSLEHRGLEHRGLEPFFF